MEKKSEAKKGKPRSAGKRGGKIEHYYSVVLPKRKLRRQLVHLLTHGSEDAARQHAKVAGWPALFNELAARPRFANLAANRARLREAAILRRHCWRAERRTQPGKRS